MRYFLKHNRKIRVNSQQGMAVSLVRQPSLVDDFYFERTTSTEDSSELIGCHNPLYMLFNQERLDRLGPESIAKWLESMKETNHSSVKDLLKKCSDEDLLSMVKSRHIQHPAELERYVQDLDSRADKFNREIARVRAEMKLEEEQRQQQQQQVTQITE